MYCTKCGKELDENQNFCHGCGTQKGGMPVANPQTNGTIEMRDKHRLYSFYIAIFTSPLLLIIRMMTQETRSEYSWKSYEVAYVPNGMKAVMLVLLAGLTVASFLLRKNSNNPDKSKDGTSLVLNIINTVIGIGIIFIPIEM